MIRSVCRVLAVLAAAVVAVIALTGAPAGASTKPPAAAPTCGGTLRVTSLTGDALTCSFDDEFDGTALDTSKWTPVTSLSSGLVAGSGGCFVNSPNNISVSGGTLNLTARKESKLFLCPDRFLFFPSQYTAGEVASTGLFSQMFGRVAIRAKFPASTVAGLQSSLWMWPQDAASTGLQGEIDIAEEYSNISDRAIPYLHYSFDTSTTNVSTATNVPTNYYCTIDNVNAFHTYELDWTPTTLTVVYDGNVCLQDNVSATGGSPFDQPFFVALTQSLGVGNNTLRATTPLPATTQIDYVRAWK